MWCKVLHCVPQRLPNSVKSVNRDTSRPTWLSIEERGNRLECARTKPWCVCFSESLAARIQPSVDCRQNIVSRVNQSIFIFWTLVWSKKMLEPGYWRFQTLTLTSVDVEMKHCWPPMTANISCNNLATWQSHPSATFAQPFMTWNNVNVLLQHKNYTKIHKQFTRWVAEPAYGS